MGDERKHLALRTETAQNGEDFIKFFRDLKGRKWQVVDVGLVGLSVGATKSVFLLVKVTNHEG